MMRDPYVVRPVAKAMKLLQCLGSTIAPMSLKAICCDAGIPKTTAFRYLRTFQECGFVTYDRQHDLYRMAGSAVALITVNAHFQQLREISSACLRNLSETCGETVNFGVIDGPDIVYLEIIQGRRALRTYARVGGRDPAHATALGKAILAFQPNHTWRRLVSPNLRKMTRRTIDTLDALDADLRRTRAVGYAVDRAENEEDTACIGIPIFGERGAPVAGLSICGTAALLEPACLAGIRAILLETGSAISAAIGSEYRRNTN
jgi:IclR family KDG regulon transcriptional repressor